MKPHHHGGFLHITTPNYRDLMMNIKLRDSDHVGELQLHLRPIAILKSAAHKTYKTLRSVGWWVHAYARVCVHAASFRTKSLKIKGL